MIEPTANAGATESGTADSNAVLLQVAANGNLPVPLPPIATTAPVDPPKSDRNGSKKFKHKKSSKISAGPFSYEGSEETESEGLPAPKTRSPSVVWGMLKTAFNAVVGPLVGWWTGSKQ